MFSVDDERYIEYLQSILATPGYESVFSSEQQAPLISRYRQGLSAFKGNPSAEAALLRLETFETTLTGAFESPDTELIFRPLLDEISLAADELGVGLKQHVLLRTSPDVSLTPAARPNSGGHILFIGRGTSSFCNYWAKVYTKLSLGLIRSGLRDQINDAEQIRQGFKQNPDSILSACKHALHYAWFGTMLGRGKDDLEPMGEPYRFELLRAMEMFVLAHEYGHFVAFEYSPELAQSSDPLDCKKLELLCDKLALQLSRRTSTGVKNWTSFSGAGAFLFLRCAELSDSIRAILPSGHPRRETHEGISDTHPSVPDRIENVRQYLMETTDADQLQAVSEYLKEVDLMISTLHSDVLSIIRDTIETQDSTG